MRCEWIFSLTDRRPHFEQSFHQILISTVYSTFRNKKKIFRLWSPLNYIIIYLESFAFLRKRNAWNDCSCNSCRCLSSKKHTNNVIRGQAHIYLFLKLKIITLMTSTWFGIVSATDATTEFTDYIHRLNTFMFRIEASRWCWTTATLF